MSPKPIQKPPIPAAFTAKKNDILASLATPDAVYTDASPKGSIDVPIRGLIDRINALEGVMTTSSCSGRISVFLEGTKGDHGGNVGKLNGVDHEGWIDVIDQVDIVVSESSANTKETEETSSKQVPRRVVPGGKGNGGRWLFVSHEPLPEDFFKAKASLSTALGLDINADANGAVHFPLESAIFHQPRLIRFQFEPMVSRQVPFFKITTALIVNPPSKILHIMTASLHHARPILTAAINSGFRESGVQSLKNLDDVNAFPMVAVRTSGLAFESLIGCCEDRDDRGERLKPLVSEHYLGMLLRIGNERFATNRERVARFEDVLFAGRDRGSQWENTEVRRERKRNVGLAQQAALHSASNDPESDNIGDDISALDCE